MVARFVRDEEAVGSNPATPTSTERPGGTSSRLQRLIVALTNVMFLMTVFEPQGLSRIVLLVSVKFWPPT